MNKTELNKILKEHKIWLDSDGKEGTRANLSRANLTNAYLSEADLSSADLSEIKGKTIITFSAGKHFAYYCDGHIKIGCKYMTVEEWSKSYEEIGKSEGYSDEEIKRYARFIMMIMEEESE